MQSYVAIAIRKHSQFGCPTLMKTYCLRTIYETKNLGFDNEGVLCIGMVGAHLARECRLPEATHKIDGVEPSGKKRVVVTTVDRTYRGQPLILEIIALQEVDDTINAAIARPDLESKTADLAALLTWSLPGTIGTRLTDALFSRKHRDPENEWTWDDYTQLIVEGYFPTLPDLKSRIDSTSQQISTKAAHPTDVLYTAMKWWRHGHTAGDPVDRFIAYWIVLETTSAELSTEDSIAARLKTTLEQLFPALAATDGGRRTNRMKIVLYTSRCKAVHSGRRELPNIQALVEMTRAIARACIEQLLDGSTSVVIKPELLSAFNI